MDVGLIGFQHPPAGGCRALVIAVGHLEVPLQREGVGIARIPGEDAVALPSRRLGLVHQIEDPGELGAGRIVVLVQADGPGCRPLRRGVVAGPHQEDRAHGERIGIVTHETGVPVEDGDGILLQTPADEEADGGDVLVGPAGLAVQEHAEGPEHACTVAGEHVDPDGVLPDPPLMAVGLLQAPQCTGGVPHAQGRLRGLDVDERRGLHGDELGIDHEGGAPVPLVHGHPGGCEEELGVLRLVMR